MKRAIVLIIVIAVAVGGGLWWHQRHNAAAPSATEKSADAEKPAAAEEGTHVSHDEQGNTVVSMSDEDQGDAGIVFGNPAAGQWSQEVKGYGRVLDPAPLAGLLNELVLAQAGTNASSREWERQKTLLAQTNTSTRALQAAEAAALHDQLAVQSVRDRLALAWGTTLAGRNDLADFVQSLALRQAVLVRVDLPGGESLAAPPATARVVTLSGKSAEAKFLSPTADVDPQFQGQGFIFTIQPNTNSLAPGQAVTVWLQVPGEPMSGVIVPHDSVLRLEGAGWVYVMNKDKGGEAFTRKKIALDRPTDAGWFVTGTLKPDDYIVVTGAQTLLSEELKGGAFAGLTAPMLNWIVKFSLRFRGVVVALACVLTGYGIYTAAHAKLDVLPNFVPPEVEVETEAPGLSPEQVEILVTRPLENTINGLGNMASLRSESIAGLSTITAVFNEGTDIFIARNMINERLGEMAGALPAGVKMPVMSPMTSSTMDLLKIGLLSTNLTPMELRTLADWVVKPRMLSIPGVARCIVFGGEVRQFQIQVQPDRLVAHGLSMTDVLEAAKSATGVVGAGFIENANQRILVQPEAPTVTPESLGEVVVSQSQGQSVRLKDVAVVAVAGAPKFGDSLIMNKPGVFLSMGSQYGANTMDVTLAVEAALKDMQPLFDRQQIMVYPRLHRPATFIENSLHNINHSLYLGAILVAVVLFAFLGHFRTAFISLTAIPLSLLTAIILLDKLGVTLNTITIGGLAISIGAVVDDAIIDVENIFRRLRENQALGNPHSTFKVTLDACTEVYSAVGYATFIVALIFLPVLTLTGLVGSFFAPLALSYILAIMASLAVALTLTPALSLLFFSKGVKHTEDPIVQRWVKAAYGKILALVSGWPRTLLAIGVLICVGACFLMPKPGDEYLPDFREGHFVLQIQTIPGTSLPEMMRVGSQITKLLLAKPEIATAEMQVGRAEQGEDTWEPNRCEFHVELHENIPGKVQAKLMDDLREMLDGFPGIQAEVVTFLGDRISETITGESAPVVVNVYGDDLDQIDDKAGDVVRVLQSIPGGKNAQVKSPPGAPRMAVRLRAERLTQLGFRPLDVLEAVETAYEGTVAAQVHEGSQVTDINVLLDPAERREPEQIGSLLLKNTAGLVMPLRELADVYLTTGRYTIQHDGASRRQVVACTPTGRDITSFVEEAKKQVAAKVNFPKGVYAVFGGNAVAAAQAQQELLIHSAIAGAGILLLLIVVTRNWRNLLLVLANVPFAMVGGVLAIWATTQFGAKGANALTIGSLVGFVTLFGITMRNSIMMVSHFEHLVSVEGVAWGHAAAIRGASERVVPILMTALVTALGLLPLAMGTGEAGQEIEGPMALVILGGLITSTSLNLLILPTLALRYGKFGVKKVSEE